LTNFVQILRDMTVLFATHNNHKYNEIRSIVPSGLTLLDMPAAGIHDDIPETGDTLEENALIKARECFRLTGIVSFADDTGLEVEFLDGEPGVRSARYAGEGKDMNRNIEKLLRKLDGAQNRSARFRTVIALVSGNGEFMFEGIAGGSIIKERRGIHGFGYDPVFLPEGSKLTFAEMPLAEKNLISHRASAFRKLSEFLSSAAFKQ